MATQDKEIEKILVTGATGFLGRHLIMQLLAQQYQVLALVRNASSRSHGLPSEVEVVEGDISDVVLLESVIAQVEVVIHTAAMVSFWKKDADRIMKVNGEGTANVVEACKDAGIRLIHVSSIAALGSVPKGAFVTEDTEWLPGEKRSAYAKSKYLAEREVIRGIAEGLVAQLVNPSVIIGPTHNWQEGTGKMFSIVDKGLSFYNPGSNGFVGVEDVARAIILVLQHDELENGAQFLLNAENLSFRELFTHIAISLGKKPPSRKLPRWPTMLVATISEWLSLISNKAPIVTRESMKSGFYSRKFDGSKIESLGLAYTPIKEVIAKAASVYRESFPS
ncbi:MAG: NAD-dependent epimerase/dehydratase family protein [Bacteroidia bacterium]|nr:NAD-dependent epimerase/dehydratase family protein [Bacteroidia bacterium]